MFGISKEQISFSKKTPELLTFPDRLIGYIGNITGPDVKELLSLSGDYMLCVRCQVIWPCLPKELGFSGDCFFFF